MAAISRWLYYLLRDSRVHGSQVDTVAIIGATLDLQEKVVRDAMTAIDDVFMLNIEARLDYDLLKQIVATGHSRIPVYEEVTVNVQPEVAIAAYELGSGDDQLTKDDITTRARKSSDGTVKTKVKKIIGILLVKQCVLLDPEGESRTCNRWSSK